MTKKMPWILVAISLLFSFNPTITVIDIFPDFFGYLMLSFCLGRLAVLNSTLEEAKKAFEKMILIDGGKLLAIIWIFGIEALSERSTSILVWCFVFAVLECIFLIPAYIKLFKGLSEIGDFFPSESIHTKRGKSRLSNTERTRNFTIFFVLFKAFMTVLPELSVLENTSMDEIGYSNSLYRYIGVMRGFCIIPVMVLGIIWAVRIFGYFRSLAKDTTLNSAMSEEYGLKNKDRRGLFIKSNVKTACWFMTVAGILTLDIRLENVNILPDILVLPMLVPAIIFFARDTKINKTKIYIFSTFYGVASVISNMLGTYYIENFTYNAMNKNATAFIVYVLSVAAVALQGAMFILLIAVIVKEMKKIISEHTGFVQGKEIFSEGEKARIAEVHRELEKGFVIAFDAAMIYVLSDVLYALYGAFYAFADVNLGFLNVVNLLFGGIFIGMMIKATGDLKEAVDTKYMLS